MAQIGTPDGPMELEDAMYATFRLVREGMELTRAQIEKMSGEEVATGVDWYVRSDAPFIKQDAEVDEDIPFGEEEGLVVKLSSWTGGMAMDYRSFTAEQVMAARFAVMIGYVR